MPIFIYYIIFMSIIGFAIMYTDKCSAKYRTWRIPEKLIFIISLMGGSIGTYLGMYIFHHKTKKKIFSIGIPLIIFCQLIFFILIINKIPNVNTIIEIINKSFNL